MTKTITAHASIIDTPREYAQPESIKPLVSESQKLSSRY